MTVASTLRVPPQFQASIRNYGDLVTYMIPAQPTERMITSRHPEYSSQVWAKEQARIMLGLAGSTGTPAATSGPSGARSMSTQAT